MECDNTTQIEKSSSVAIYFFVVFDCTVQMLSTIIILSCHIHISLAHISPLAKQHKSFIDCCCSSTEIIYRLNQCAPKLPCTKNRWKAEYWWFELKVVNIPSRTMVIIMVTILQLRKQIAVIKPRFSKSLKIQFNIVSLPM